MSETTKNQLAEKRTERGFNQFALAVKAQLNPSQLSSYENGRSFPQPEAIAAIAGALGEAPEKVYGWLITPASPVAPEPNECEECGTQIADNSRVCDEHLTAEARG